MKRITSKITTIILIGALIISLAGCSAKSGESNYSDNKLTDNSNSAQEHPAPGLANDGVANGKGSEQKDIITIEFDEAAEYADTYFENYGVNPQVRVSEDSQSTFALDVDTASYTKARNYINQGSLPPKDSIRVEEFVNYFKRHYDAPSDDTFSIYTEVAPSAFNKGYHMVEVGVQGKKVVKSEKKNSILTFVIDISGSMNMENRLGLVKKSLNMLVDQMSEEDSIGIAVYGSRGRKLLEHTTGDNKKAIKEKINELDSEGSTNAAEGLRIGFEMANKNFVKNANNRIILCTDGVANQGLTDAEEILKTVEDYSKRGITLSSFGFGMDNYNDIFLEKLANKGDGNYSYVDSIEEAKKIFTGDITSLLQVIAKDTKAQIEFDSNSVETYRLIGYENRKLEDKDFKNDNVDAGEIGAGHAVTALYEVKLKESLDNNLAVVKLRYKDPQTGEVDEISKAIKSSDVKSDFNSATPRFRFINMVAQFAEILRGSEYSNADISEIYDLLKKDEKNLVASDEDKEFIELVERLVEISPVSQR